MKLREMAEKYANQFVAVPRKELEPWQEERARDFIAGFKACAEMAARIAAKGCLVPPDGGSPTESEADMCDGIAKAIRKLADSEGA